MLTNIRLHVTIKESRAVNTITTIERRIMNGYNVV